MEINLNIKSPVLDKLLAKTCRCGENDTLEAINETRRILMTAFTDLKDAVNKYIADVAIYKANVTQLIADAIAAHDAGEDVDLMALKDAVDVADADLTTPTV